MFVLIIKLFIITDFFNIKIQLDNQIDKVRKQIKTVMFTISLSEKCFILKTIGEKCIKVKTLRISI